MARHAANFALAILLPLAALGQAQANHCPREFGSQCCGRTDPGPHPRASEGWRWACEWPDNCHHRCHGVRDGGADGGGTGGSGPLLGLPQNTVQGSCGAFNDRMRSPGITTRDGDTLKNHAGYTLPEVRFEPRWTWQTASSTQEGGKARVCIKVTAVVPNFSLEVLEQDVFSWQPEGGPQGSCRAAYEDWLRKAIGHEREHVRRSEEIVRQSNANWDPHGYTPTVCASRADRDLALEAAKVAAGQRVNARLERAARQTNAALKRDEKKMHETSVVPPMDCSSCP